MPRGTVNLLVVSSNPTPGANENRAYVSLVFYTHESLPAAVLWARPGDVRTCDMIKLQKIL
ncbi:MAG: hypothetical protein A3J06_03890 [Candidatus Moranbacteria bacterium RIFCSPLOWO2_02_FULL_48_19]|nr:MAG: hypothetical protein A3J06_03890 [Candidatus Moranbacteria bacterium RIFCSPLOWO2_02_FULL_48_19]